MGSKSSKNGFWVWAFSPKIWLGPPSWILSFVVTNYPKVYFWASYLNTTKYTWLFVTEIVSITETSKLSLSNAFVTTTTLMSDLWRWPVYAVLSHLAKGDVAGRDDVDHLPHVLFSEGQIGLLAILGDIDLLLAHMLQPGQDLLSPQQRSKPESSTNSEGLI